MPEDRQTTREERLPCRLAAPLAATRIAEASGVRRERTALEDAQPRRKARRVIARLRVPRRPER